MMRISVTKTFNIQDSAAEGQKWLFPVRISFWKCFGSPREQSRAKQSIHICRS
jgi:hypothetical protein